MRCEDIQLIISLYDGESPSTTERRRVEGHLAECPLCRVRLADTREVVRDLRLLPRLEPGQGLGDSIRAAVMSEVGLATITGGTPTARRRSWMEHWLLPGTVGGLASVALGFLIIGSVFVSGLGGGASGPTSPAVYLTSSPPGRDLAHSGITPTEYARTRLDVSGESPSLNPNGALVALTKSLFRGEMKDDEVVVVAEVLGNGLARVDEVLQPSRDDRAVLELRKALQSDPAYAPFVPADIDGRSESVRVVLRIQNVDVDTRLPRHRKL